MSSSPPSEPAGIGMRIEGLSAAPGALEQLVRTLGGRSLGGLIGMTYDLDGGSLSVRLAAGEEAACWSMVTLSLPTEGGPDDVACETLPVRLRRSPSRPLRPSGLGIDHVAVVVHSLDEALAELAAADPSLRPMPAWDFPELRSTAVAIPLDGCYLELNQPWDAESFFPSVGRGERGHLAFVCLRVAELGTTREVLGRAGVATGESVAVRARPAGTAGKVREIGRVAWLRRSATGGLSTMLIQTGWPWDGTGSTADLSG